MPSFSTEAWDVAEQPQTKSNRNQTYRVAPCSR